MFDLLFKFNIEFIKYVSESHSNTLAQVVTLARSDTLQDHQKPGTFEKPEILQFRQKKN